jgi:hypothetical protein
MQLKKIENHFDFDLYAPLEDMLNKLYLKVPRLNFQSKSIGHVNGATDKTIYGVDVYNGNEMVGEIHVEWGMYRRQDYGNVYTIYSPRIKNRIHPRNAKVSKLPTEALKIAVKTFAAASSVVEIINHVKQKMASEIGGVQYNAVRQAERLGDDYLIPLMEFVMEVSRGGMPTISAELDKMVKKPNLNKMLNTSRIATSVNSEYKAGTGVVIREERDGTLTSISLDATMLDDARVRNVKDTYDLPELYQTKLAMLRILDYNQPVESIGVKFSIEKTNWYYLTGGEIITTS